MKKSLKSIGTFLLNLIGIKPKNKEGKPIYYKKISPTLLQIIPDEGSNVEMTITIIPPERIICLKQE